MAVQPAELAADAAPFPDRDAAITDAGVNHPGQDQLRPAVAARALGSEVIVLESIRRGNCFATSWQYRSVIDTDLAPGPAPSAGRGGP